MAVSAEITQPGWFHPNRQSLWYVGKILAGAMISWFGLGALGLHQPYWAIITICIASDPDLTSAKKLVGARALNTLVGAAVGLAGVMIGGLTTPTLFICLGITTFLVTAVPRYPANWRLAPVTVVIIMEVSVLEGRTRDAEIHIAEMRVLQVLAGCAIALGLAWITSRWYRPAEAAK
jgi:uncharacterized membrane protein YccC